MNKEEFLESIVSNPFLRNFIPSLDVLQFIACQFALESDFGMSRMAIIHRNYCGMKYPHRRFTYSSGRIGEFSSYSSLNACIKDYLSWIFYNRPYQNSLECLDSFMLFLRDSGYCPEKDYISRIEYLYNQYFISSKN